MTATNTDGHGIVLMAYELIGYDGDMLLRIKGGRALYETVCIKDGYNDGPVILARLEITDDNRIHQVNRWVDPLTWIELVDPDTVGDAWKGV